jgi:hypothetical protein
MRSTLAAFVVGAALLAGWSGGAAAQTPLQLERTRDLVELCAPLPGPERRAALSGCAGFIIGTGKLYIALVEAQAIRPWACPAATPSLEQARDSFVAWARAHPEHLDEPVVDGFWRAMAATYPCP